MKFSVSSGLGRIVRVALFAAGLLGAAGTAIAGSEVVVFKSQYCGCCDKWVEHMEQAGFEVETRNEENMGAIKSKFGVPRSLASCHTAVVDGKYLVEGHVPAHLVKRMVEADGEPMGLAVPGMPAGSPGMESPNPVTYDVIAAGADGRTYVYETVQGKAGTHGHDH